MQVGPEPREKMGDDGEDGPDYNSDASMAKPQRDNGRKDPPPRGPQPKPRAAPTSSRKMKPIKISGDVDGMILSELFCELLGTALIVFCGLGSSVTYRGTFPLCGGDVPETRFIVTTGGRSGGGPTPADRFQYPCRNEYQELGAQMDNYKHYSVIHAPSAAESSAVALAFGIAVATILTSIGHVSGGHMNPAVSLGMVTAGEMSLIKALMYSGAQVLGAIVGAGVLKLLTWTVLRSASPAGNPLYHYGWDLTKPSTVEAKTQIKTFYEMTNTERLYLWGWDLGINFLDYETHYMTGILLEVVRTFVVVLCASNYYDSKRPEVRSGAPMSIGFALFLTMSTASQYWAVSTNPARSIGPAVWTVTEKAQHLWELPVFIIGPILGGLLAGIVFNLAFAGWNPKDQKTK